MKLSFGLSFLLLSFLLAGLVCPSILHAQNKQGIDTHISISKMKARAAHASKMGDAYTSLFYYEEIVRKDSTDLEMRYDLAELYQITRNYPKAEKHFDYVYVEDPANYAIALYHKGIVQKMQGKYPEAKKNLLAFKKTAKSISDNGIKMLLEKDIAGCDSGMIYQEFQENFRVKNAGNSVNNPHAEFSPYYMDNDNIIFGSLRMDSIQYFDIREESIQAQPTRKVFKASYENGVWNEKGLLEELESTHGNIGDITYSPYTKRYYYSKCIKTEHSKPSCKLYYTDKTQKQYYLNAPINQEGFTSSQPAVMYDSVTKAEVLYYVTDRPGGKGGLDIWYAPYNPVKKKWGSPSNFSVANTAGTEFAPYADPQGKFIYFSSTGNGSAGGLDIFRTKREGKKFSRPENLGFPINSPQDDFDYCQNEVGDKGFVVSNRPGGTPYFHETCCDDIFTFEKLPAPVFNKTIKVTVFTDKECKSSTLTVLKFDKRKGIKTSEVLSVEGCVVNYPLYKNTSYQFFATKPEYKTDTLKVSYQKVLESDTLSGVVNLIKVVQKTDPVFASIETNPSRNSEKVSDQNKNITAFKENSEKNSHPASDEDANKNQNTVNAIAGTSNTKSSAANVVEKADVKMGPSDTSLASNLKKPNLSSNENGSLKYRTKPKVILADKPSLETTFTLRDFQYEYGMAELDSTNRRILDSLLVPFMAQNPGKRLQISSHTDNVGSHHFNMNLSEKRAFLVKEYLITKGIEKHRLLTKGSGETKPIAPNQNPDGSDDPIGRGLNRRTEFVILK